MEVVQRNWKYIHGYYKYVEEHLLVGMPNYTSIAPIAFALQEVFCKLVKEHTLAIPC